MNRNPTPNPKCPECQGTGLRCCGSYIGAHDYDQPPECCGLPERCECVPAVCNVEKKP